MIKALNVHMGIRRESRKARKSWKEQISRYSYFPSFFPLREENGYRFARYGFYVSIVLIGLMGIAEIIFFTIFLLDYFR